jgi:hypothetical protein
VSDRFPSRKAFLAKRKILIPFCVEEQTIFVKPTVRFGGLLKQSHPMQFSITMQRSNLGLMRIIPKFAPSIFACQTAESSKIFQTNRGPVAKAIFECRYDELEASLVTIDNILSRDSVLRDHPLQDVDRGVPIEPRLTSRSGDPAHNRRRSPLSGMLLGSARGRCLVTRALLKSISYGH